MLCPKCKSCETQVIDSRDSSEGIRRRRACQSCKYRFTTYERVEIVNITVVKKDGNRERFSPEKIRQGVVIACKNRPVSSVQIDTLVSDVEQQVYLSGKEEVRSQEIGDLVRAKLKELDEVAYVRFVSVYQAFSDLKQFTNTINTI